MHLPLWDTWGFSSYCWILMTTSGKWWDGWKKPATSDCSWGLAVAGQVCGSDLSRVSYRPKSLWWPRWNCSQLPESFSIFSEKSLHLQECSLPYHSKEPSRRSCMVSLNSENLAFQVWMTHWSKRPHAWIIHSSLSASILGLTRILESPCVVRRIRLWHNQMSHVARSS